MDSFGLGIILNFTDNATSGMLSASSALQRLSNSADTASGSASVFQDRMNGMLKGMNLNIMGDLMTNTGQSILSVFSNLISNVQKTGSEFESFRITLNQIYGDAETANKQLDKLMNFSATTPFEVNDVKDLLVTLKSQGIEAFDEMTSKSGKLRQANLAWLGDLMTFKPEVPAQRWKIAIQNYVGSGEGKVLRNLLDMGEIDQILGHEIGGSIEERWNDIVEIVDKKNLGGLMAANMGTFTQVLSNVEDQFTRLYLKIADAGPFNSLKISLNNLVSTFADLEDSDVQAFADSIASGLTLVLKPLEGVTKILGDLVSKAIKFSSAHPYLMQVVTVIGAIAGVGLVVFGTLLKFSGSLYMLTNALQGLPSLTSLVTESLGMLSRGLFSLAASVLPFALMAALAYTAWTSNLFGIQDATRDVSNVVGLHIKALIASWDGVLTLEEYDWIEKAGLLPFVNAIQDLKYSFGILADGVKEGFLSVFNEIDTTFQRITGAGRSLKDIIDNLAQEILGVSGYEHYEEVWRGIGQTIGKVGGVLAIVIPFVKILGMTVSVATSPITLMVGGILLLGKGIMYLKDNMRDADGNLTKLGKTVKSVVSFIGGIFDKLFAKGGESPFKRLFESLIGPDTLVGFNSQLEYMAQAIPEAFEGIVSKIDFKKMGVILTAGFLLAFKPSMILAPIKGVFNSIKKLLPFSGSSDSGSSEGGGFKFNIPNPKTVLKAIMDMAIIIGGMTFLIFAYGALSSSSGFNEYMSRGVDNLIIIFKGVAEMSLGLGALTVITGIASKLGSPASFLKGMLSIAEIIGGFTFIFAAVGALAQAPEFGQFISSGTQTVEQLTTGMGGLCKPSFLIMVAGVAALGMLSPAIVLAGMVGVAIIIGGFGLIIAAFAALNEIPGFADFMARGCDVLIMLATQIGEMIGSFVGGVLGGIGEGVTKSLIVMADNLSAFSEHLKPFFENLKSYDTSAVAPFLDAFGSFMLKMTADKGLSFLFGDVNFEELGDGLSVFSEKAKPFFDNVAKYPPEGLKNSALVFSSLGDLGGYATKSGGIAQMFTGTTDLAGLGENLTAFSEKAAAFYVWIAPVPTEAFDKSEYMFQKLGAMGDYTFKFGGFAQMISGEIDIGKVGEQLAAFKNSVADSDFFGWIDGIDTTTMDKTEYLFQKLSAMGDYAFKFGGFAQMVSGETRIDLIALQLKQFAVQAKSFFEWLVGIDDKEINKMEKLLVSLGNAASAEAFQSGGIKQLFTGTAEIGAFGEDLGEFASEENAPKFFAWIEGIDDSVIEKVGVLFGALSSAANACPDSGGLAQLFTGSKDLGSFGVELAAFADADGIDRFFGLIEDYSDTIPLIAKFFETLYFIGTNFFGDNGVIAIFNNNSSANISQIGVMVAAFVQGTAGFFSFLNANITDKSLNKAEKFFKVFGKLKDLASINSKLSGLGYKGTELTNFINNANGFFITAKDLDTSGVEKVKNALKDLFSISGSTDIEGLKNIVAVLSDLSATSSKLGTDVETLAKTVETSFNKMVTDCTKAIGNMKNEVVKGLGSLKTSVETQMNSIVSSITNKFNNLKTNAKTYGANMMSAFIDGIRSKISELTNVISTEVMTPVKDHIGFNSPSKKGEGRHIVEWGYNMISGFTDGVNLAYGLLENTLKNCITNPVDKVVNSVDKAEILAEVNQTNKPLNANRFVPVPSTSQINNNNSSEVRESVSDNRVIFSEGSIVIQCSNASSPSELESMAEKLMKIIERKKRIKGLAVRPN